MRMLSILVKVSHHVGGKPRSITLVQCSTQWALLLSLMHITSLQFATLFIMKLWVCDGTSLKNSYTFEYAHIVSSIGWKGMSTHSKIVPYCTYIEDHTKVVQAISQPVPLSFLGFGFTVSWTMSNQVLELCEIGCTFILGCQPQLSVPFHRLWLSWQQTGGMEADISYLRHVIQTNSQLKREMSRPGSEVAQSLYICFHTITPIQNLYNSIRAAGRW